MMKRRLFKLGMLASMGVALLIAAAGENSLETSSSVEARGTATPPPALSSSSEARDRSGSDRASGQVSAEPKDSQPETPAPAEPANAASPSSLELLESIHELQAAIQRARSQDAAAAALSSELLAERLQAIEQTLATRRGQELETMQSTNRVMLAVTVALAALAVATVLGMSWLQWRAFRRWIEISARPPEAGPLAESQPVPALAAAEAGVRALRPAEQADMQLHVALDELKNRIGALEQITRVPPSEISNGDVPTAPLGEEHEARGNGNGASPADRIDLLLGKGQSLLSQDHPNEALACLDEALTLDPAQPRVLMKKGATLEQLGKWNEALECYDRALAADNSLTLAYIYKGGVYNRLRRFQEALECYEQALATRGKFSSNDLRALNP